MFERVLDPLEPARGARLRGLFLRVVEEGEAGHGDRVRVLSRDAPSPPPA